MSDFPNHWDFKTIGDFASRVRTKNTGGECQDPMTISAIDGLVSQRDYFNKIVASKNTEGYTLLHKNDFAYNKSYSDGYPVGAVRRLKTKDRGIVSPLYICFELDREQIDLNFADYLFDSDWFVQAIYGIAKEGARSHGLLNIGIEEFFSASLPMPPLSEQKKISEILSGIKNVAYAKRVKVAKEKDLMKSMRNIFFSSSPYASSDLTGRTKWDEGSRVSALKEICSVRQGLQIPISERSKSRADGMLPYLTVAWINSGFSIIKAEYIKAPRSSVVLKDDEFVVARTGAVGKVFGGIKCVFHNNFFAVKTHPGTLPDYVKHYLKWGAIQREMLDRAGTTSIPDLNHGDFYAIKIPLPGLGRQKFIVRMLSCLEKKIDCLKREIEVLDTLFEGISADLLSGRKRVSDARIPGGVGI
jgi:type I restriction enzyme S subunit